MVEQEYLTRLGVALRAAIEYRGTTPQAVADELGVVRETVYRWRAGRHPMSASEAAAAAAFLDAPGDLFIRPPETWGAAMAMMAAWDEVRARPDGPPPSASRP